MTVSVVRLYVIDEVKSGNELARMWTNLSLYPCICPEELRTVITSVRLVGFQTMILPWDFLRVRTATHLILFGLSRKQDCYALDRV
jgi:hypothetical protein